MLSPKRVKFRRQHRGRRAGLSRGQQRVEFGDYGLKALEPGWLTNRQIEAARIAMTRKIKRGGKVWINIFPDKPVTQKPAETRMGSGKGSPEHWSPWSSPAASCSSWPACPSRWRRRRSGWQGASCRSRRGWYDGRLISLRARDLRDLTDDELEHQLAERRQELFNLRFQGATGALENTARLKLAKREIARILTVRTEREANANRVTNG